MKKNILILAAIALCVSASAFAAPSSQGCNSSDETPPGCITYTGGQGSQSGAGGAGGAGGNVTIGNVTPTATVTATQGNTQSTVFTSPNDIILRNVPSVNGPALTSSNDTCMGSTSGSINIAGLGVGGGSSWVDTNCKRLKNARELWNMGMKPAALALLCMDSENKEALELTGFVCPTKTVSKAASVKTNNTVNDPVKY